MNSLQQKQKFTSSKNKNKNNKKRKSGIKANYINPAAKCLMLLSFATLLTGGINALFSFAIQSLFQGADRGRHIKMEFCEEAQELLCVPLKTPT